MDTATFQFKYSEGAQTHVCLYVRSQKQMSQNYWTIDTSYRFYSIIRIVKNNILEICMTKIIFHFTFTEKWIEILCSHESKIRRNTITRVHLPIAHGRLISVRVPWNIKKMISTYDKSVSREILVHRDSCNENTYLPDG